MISGTTLSIPIFKLQGPQKEKGARKGGQTRMAKNYPNLKNETDIQLQDAQKVLRKMNPNRPTTRHIIIKMEKVKIKREF